MQSLSFVSNYILYKHNLLFFLLKISMSAAQTMEGVSTRVSTQLVLTSVSVGVDMHYPSMSIHVKVCMHVLIHN